MAWLDESIVNTYVRELISSKLHDSFVAAKPLLSWLAGESTAKLDKLGDPQASMFFGGRNLGMGQKATISGSTIHKFRYKSAQTDGATTVEAGASTPTASGFAEDNRGTAGVVWHRYMVPIKVREDSIENVQNGGFGDAMRNIKIADVLEEAVNDQVQMGLEALQSRFWTGTLTAAQQDQTLQTWPGIIGVQHWCSDGSSTGETAFTDVGGVDRTVETPLKSNIVDADDLASSVPTLRLLRQIRLLSTYGNVRKKRADAGRLIVTTPDLWDVLANEADGKNQINSNDIPQFARAGHANPAIRLDDAFIVWDHDCPSGEIYFFTPESWVFEVQRGSNFQPMDMWTRKWATEEGGGYYRWNNLKVKCRLTCREPWLQVKGRDFTTS